jgi:hypothetical protein
VENRSNPQARQEDLPHFITFCLRKSLKTQPGFLRVPLMLTNEQGKYLKFFRIRQSG